MTILHWITIIQQERLRNITEKNYLKFYDYMLDKKLDKTKEIIDIEKFDKTKILIDADDKLQDDITLLML